MKRTISNRSYIIALVGIFLFIATPLIKLTLFSWDDFDFLYSSTIKNGGFFDILTSNHYGLYHPVTTTYVKLAYFFLDNNTLLLHALAIIIHLINAFLVFLLVKSFTQEAGASVIAFSIFLFHPLNVEVYAWLVNIKDLLSVLFSLLSILFYLKYSKKSFQINSFFLLFTVFSILAVLSKPTAVVLPLVFILIDYKYARNIDVKSVLDKSIILVVSILIVYVNLTVRTSYYDLSSIPQFSPLNRVFLSSYVFFHYLLSAALPHNLSVFYPYPFDNDTVSSAEYIFYFSLSVVYLLGLSYFFIKKKRSVVFFMAVAILTLSPVLQIIPIGDSIFNDRYLYFYLVFYSLSIGVLWKSIILFIKRGGLQVALKLVLLMLMVFYVYSTYQRIELWKLEIDLFRHDFRNNPNSEILANALGSSYMKSDEIDSALFYFDIALKLDSNYSAANLNKGLVYEKMGDLDSSNIYLKKALKRNKNSKRALYHLSRNYYLMDENNMSLFYISKVVRTKQMDAKCYNLLGQIFYKQNELTKSIDAYYKACKLSSSNPIYLYNYAISLGSNNELDQAISMLNKAIQINPRFHEAYYLRGVAKARKGYNGCSDLIRAQELGNRMAKKALDAFCR